MAYGRDKFTEVSARQWDFVTRNDLSARDAVAFLMNGMRVRSFRDILRQVCGRIDLEQPLVEGLCAISPGTQPDSIRRKVRNWFSGKNLPTEREDVFRICFASGLDLGQSGAMLTFLTEQGIHYRNMQEMVYAYCLRYGMDYGYAGQLLQQLQAAKSGPGTRKDPRNHTDKADHRSSPLLQHRARNIFQVKSGS